MVRNRIKSIMKLNAYDTKLKFALKPAREQAFLLEINKSSYHSIN